MKFTLKHKQMSIPDKQIDPHNIPNGDLAKGSWFMITGWCGEYSYIKTETQVARNMIVQNQTVTPEQDEGTVPNKTFFGVVFNVIEVSYPYALCRIYGPGLPGKYINLNLKHFETFTPSYKFAQAIRKSSMKSTRTGIIRKIAWLLW